MTAPFDPASEAFTANPYPFYHQLRHSGQPVWHDALGLWLLSTYEQVDTAARSPQLVRSRDAFLDEQQQAAARTAANWHAMPNHQRYVQFSLLESDGPVHERLRLIALRTFTRRAVAEHQQQIQALVDAQLDQLLGPAKDRGPGRCEIDFIADLAAPLPGAIIGLILGVPAADSTQLRRWSEDIVQFFDIERTAEHKALAERATSEFADYLKDLLLQRRHRPTDDLLSTLQAAQLAGKLSEDELLSTCMLILMAGHGSTIDVLGTGLLALLRHPDQLARLRQQPGLMGTAVQEMFRYDAPLPFFHRYAAEDLTLFGQRWPQGTKFGLLYGAANRDTDHFAGADQFDIGRTPNRHLAFGRGAHLCLGNHLARLDMEILFRRLLERTGEIRMLAPTPSFRPGLTARGLTALPLELAPA